MEEHLTCICGWEGSPEQLDQISEEVDVAHAMEEMSIVDANAAMENLGTPCCPNCRQTYFGE